MVALREDKVLVRKTTSTLLINVKILKTQGKGKLKCYVNSRTKPNLFKASNN
jgi:hypothetical protein